jgi:hypothetical protein
MASRQGIGLEKQLRGTVVLAIVDTDARHRRVAMGQHHLDHLNRAGGFGLAVDARDQQRADAEVGARLANAGQDAGLDLAIGQARVAIVAVGFQKNSA